MGPIAGTTFGVGTPYTMSSPWQTQPWQQLSQVYGQLPYGQNLAGGGPLQVLQIIQQQVQQLQALQQHQLMQIQQLLQFVPAQLQQIQQLLQLIPLQFTQSHQGLQPFGPAGTSPLGLNPFQQSFGQGASHVM